jgi:diguanylate cyclase (GGDEF)-like protein
MLPSRWPDAKMPEFDSLKAIELLVEVVEQLSLAREMPAVTAIVDAAALQLTGADGASFVLRQGDWSYHADEKAIAPLWKGQRFPINECISGWVMQHRQSATIPDIFADDRIPAEDYRPTFVRSLAMVPIRIHDPIGAIGIYWSQPHNPTLEQVRLLQALANSTAVAIENIRINHELEERVRERTAELEKANEALRTEAVLRKHVEQKVLRLSLTDELTGLNNRRGFLLRAEQLVKLAHRLRNFGWLVYLDLDGLKQVNDELGHDAGDRLLITAGRILRETFRDSDVIGRIGGDEFVVFATGKSTPADEVEERLKRNIESHNQKFPDQPALAMSIGIIRCDPQSTQTLEDMIHLADAAMYAEKKSKRGHHPDDSDE